MTATEYQITWRAGDEAGAFELRPVDDSGDAVDTSPVIERSVSVAWGWRMPPAPIPEARRAHDALVERLLVAGWRRAGVGDAWFAHRFHSPERRPSLSAREPKT